MKINIESVQNGWTIAPDQKTYLTTSEVKVARSPKELCSLVEAWATGEGKPEEKKAKP